MKRIAAALALGMFLVVGSTFAGTVYTAKTTSEGGRQAAMESSTVKGWVSGDKAKIEFEESGNPMMAKGSYLITKDGGTTMFLVSTKDKTYMKWDMEGMMNMAGGAMKMMNMKITDPVVEKLGEEPDGIVAGLPTMHYKFRTSYAMSMSFMGMNQHTKSVSEDEIWSAPKLVEAALGLWTKRTPPSMGNEEFAKLVKAQMSTIQGFPLKRRTVHTTTDDKGKTQTTTTVMEVTDLQTTVVPDSTFEIPADYKETSMGGEGDDNPMAKMFGGTKK
jgi:hypothetical protein